MIALPPMYHGQPRRNGSCIGDPRLPLRKWPPRCGRPPRAGHRPLGPVNFERNRTPSPCHPSGFVTMEITPVDTANAPEVGHGPACRGQQDSAGTDPAHISTICAKPDERSRPRPRPTNGGVRSRGTAAGFGVRWSRPPCGSWLHRQARSSTFLPQKRRRPIATFGPGPAALHQVFVGSGGRLATPTRGLAAPAGRRSARGRGPPPRVRRTSAEAVGARPVPSPSPARRAPNPRARARQVAPAPRVGQVARP